MRHLLRGVAAATFVCALSGAAHAEVNLGLLTGWRVFAATGTNDVSLAPEATTIVTCRGTKGKALPTVTGLSLTAGGATCAVGAAP